MPRSPTNATGADTPAVDAEWTLLCAFLVFFMQAGFALLEAGHAPAKNTLNILMKNMLDACAGVLAFYAVGFALASGDGYFAGYKHFLLIGYDNYAYVLFQFSFAVNCATIFGGSVAGRMRFMAYFTVACSVTSIIFPPVAHWMWASGGWLRQIGSNGIIDFSGSCVVHMVGGLVGLMGAIIIGPRQGRFHYLRGSAAADLSGHSMPMACLGTLILWFGWFGFNAGSTLSVSGARGQVAARAALNTALSPAAAGVVVFVLNRTISEQYDLGMLCNGVLAGLVGITGSCAVVEPWAACIIGAVSALVVTLCSWLLVRFRVDDPLDAAPIHAGCGLWGLLSVGLFATKQGVQQTLDSDSVTAYGVLLGGGWEQLGVQVLGGVCAAAWTCILSGALFACMRWRGALRVTPETEAAGLDILKHGRVAYTEFQLISASSKS